MQNVEGDYDEIIEDIKKYKMFNPVKYVGSQSSGHGELVGVVGRVNVGLFSINEDYWEGIDQNKVMAVRFSTDNGFHLASRVRIEEPHLSHKIRF